MMIPWIRTAIAAAALSLGLTCPVLAQQSKDLLPDGPGKDAVLRVCTRCHEAEQFAQARYTPQQWDFEIEKMQSAGAYMTADEQLAISAYLAAHLSPGAPAAETDKPQNVKGGPADP